MEDFEPFHDKEAFEKGIKIIYELRNLREFNVRYSNKTFMKQVWSEDLI